VQYHLPRRLLPASGAGSLERPERATNISKYEGRDMGIHAWAARKTWSCASADCRSSSKNLHPECGRQIARSGKEGAGAARNELAGYCALIWSQPIEIDGSIIGTAVSDQNVFRFFSADVRLDELDGRVWETLPALRTQVVFARSLIMARLPRERLID
jgi:hypothetical protein